MRMEVEYIFISCVSLVSVKVDEIEYNLHALAPTLISTSRFKAVVCSVAVAIIVIVGVSAQTSIVYSTCAIDAISARGTKTSFALGLATVGSSTLGAGALTVDGRTLGQALICCTGGRLWNWVGKCI